MFVCKLIAALESGDLDRDKTASMNSTPFCRVGMDQGPNI